MYVRAGRPAFAWPCVGVHRSTSLMSSSLLLQQCPACLVRLTWVVFVMGGRWPYSWCLMGCCRQDLFNIARKSYELCPIIVVTFSVCNFYANIITIIELKSYRLIDWLIGINGMSTSQGLFMYKGYGIVYIVRSYLHFLCNCFSRLFLHTVL